MTSVTHSDSTLEWAEYNRLVSSRASAIASSERAARAWHRPPLPTEPEGMEFRYCLPGPGGFSAYCDRLTGMTCFLKMGPLGWIELGRETVVEFPCEKKSRESESAVASADELRSATPRRRAIR
jgi:hypothetical protein